MCYEEDEGMFDPLLISLGLFVGVLVGLTGIGGGVLLTPLLMLTGSLPEVVLGTWLCSRRASRPLGVSIAVMLALAGVHLL